MRQWSEDLLVDRAQSVAEIAQRGRVGSGYVRGLMQPVKLVCDKLRMKLFLLDRTADFAQEPRSEGDRRVPSMGGRAARPTDGHGA